MKLEWNKVTWYSKLGAIILFLLVIPVLTFYIGTQYELAIQANSTPPVPISPQQPVKQTPFDGKNSTFTIDGESVTLTNGISEVPAAPGSAEMITTNYFGDEAMGDLNGDGQPDTAFLITQDTGGSGLFYYAVVALKTASGYKTTNAFFIGDRIAPQSLDISTSSQELEVNYADRKPGEPMTTQPSVGTTLLLKVTPDGVLERP